MNENNFILMMKHFYKNIKWNIIITLCRPSMVILITSARCCRESRIAPDGGQGRFVENACLGRGSRHDLCWWGVCAESRGQWVGRVANSSRRGVGFFTGNPALPPWRVGPGPKRNVINLKIRDVIYNVNQREYKYLLHILVVFAVKAHEGP